MHQFMHQFMHNSSSQPVDLYMFMCVYDTSCRKDVSNQQNSSQKICLFKK